MIREIDARISRALGRVRLAFRAVLTRVSDGPSVQLLQGAGLAGETLQDNELFQHYGVISKPLPGTMAIVLPVGGKTAHGVVIATEHSAYRLKDLAPGEVAIYTDEDQGAGHRIHLKRGNEIHLVAGASSIVMTPDGITITTPSLDIIKAS